MTRWVRAHISGGVTPFFVCLALSVLGQFVTSSLGYVCWSFLFSNALYVVSCMFYMTVL